MALIPLLVLVLTALHGANAGGAAAADARAPLCRSGFPAGFVFGTASAAYQYEGAAREDGRGSSIWDTFTHNHSNEIADRSNGDVAVDFYHLYKEDTCIMKEMGLDAFRFSISWSRILPNGTLSGGVNKEGIRYYNNLINELISNGLKPFVTLFHWDLPQTLEDQYGGFLSSNIIHDFGDFADLCFKEFGDRVKHWITFNEPWTFTILGYATGTFAPGRCSVLEVGKCRAGDSGREPYIVAHHMLLAHAAAVHKYKHKYQAHQEGKIGITLVSNWFVPYSNSKSDHEAFKRALDFMYGWFMDPLVFGDYPHIMKTLVGDRLPRFNRAKSDIVRGSFDFIGLNYYTSNYAKNIPFSNTVNTSYTYDIRVNMTGLLNGIPIGPQAASSWIYVYPRGMRDLLLYTKHKYKNPIIYITENGIDEANNATLSLEEALKDDMRIRFHKEHLFYLQKAIGEGVDVRGYFAWSLLDNFEWTSGYTVRFGLNYVDYENGLKRYPKSSALWFKDFLKK